MNIVLPYTPFDFQKAFHRDTSRFRYIVGGRRVGKSKCALQECIRACLTIPGAKVWWVSPTLGDARDVGFEDFKLYIDVLAPAIKCINNTRMKVDFVNNSTLMFKGGENERSLRGRGLDFVALSEAAYCHPDIWNKALRPSLADKKGRAVLESTTNGRNWYWEQYVRVKESLCRNRKLWGLYQWPTSLNPMIGPEEIEMFKAEHSEVDFRQEFMAEFITKAGQVYGDFNDENYIAEWHYAPHWDIYIGADFGFANPTAIVFCAVDRQDGNVVIFDEIYEAHKTIQETTEKIRQKLRDNGIPQKNVVAVYTDPAGNAKELTSGISPVDYLRMDGGFNVTNKGSEIQYGVSLVRSFVKAANGKRRLRVLQKCENTIKSFLGYSYTVCIVSGVIKEEPAKDGVYDHICDATRYFFINRFDRAKWVCSNIAQVEMYSNGSQGKPIVKHCAQCRRPYTSRTGKNHPPFLCNNCQELKDAQR